VLNVLAEADSLELTAEFAGPAAGCGAGTPSSAGLARGRGMMGRLVQTIDMSMAWPVSH
jgi:hypothetical protein